MKKHILRNVQKVFFGMYLHISLVVSTKLMDLSSIGVDHCNGITVTTVGPSSKTRTALSHVYDYKGQVNSFPPQCSQLKPTVLVVWIL